MFDKNYRKRSLFEKVMAKIKRCSCFCLTVYFTCCSVMQLHLSFAHYLHIYLGLLTFYRIEFTICVLLAVVLNKKTNDRP